MIIMAGVYAFYSKRINKEIEIAKYYHKPIIVVKYWGAERISTVVQNAADIVVGWGIPSLWPMQ